MPLEDKTTDDAASDAEFGAAFEGKEPPVKEKSEPATSARVKEEPKPEYVQLTKDDLAALRAAASEVSSLKQQQSKAFGTIGNLQKVINELQTNRKAELSTTAFAKMKEQFPELAELTHEAVTNATKQGPDEIKRLLSEQTTAREVEALEDAYPDWKDIVGAVDQRQGHQPDPDNAFRKWLGTKDAAYQTRLNATESAAVISRAITLFQNETRQQPRPAARADTRREQIAAAVQPRGDGAPASSRKTDDDEFTAGFNSG